MRRVLTTVGMCLLLVLAGCSFLPGGTTSAPGVDDGELSDGDALLDAHAETLSESGYSHDLTVNRTGTVDGERVEDVQRQRMEVAAGSSEYVRQVIYGGQARIVAWGNESVEYQRIERGEDVTYRRSSPESARPMTGVNVIEPHLTAPFEVVETETVDDRTLLTLESTGQPTDEAAFPRNASAVESYDATLVVDGDGRVHRLDVSGAYERDGESGSYELTYELTSASPPGVERPGWVEQLEG